MRNVASEFLHFVHETTDLDTSVVSVVSKRTVAQLGTLRWYPAWRQYVFYPSMQTLFNGRCLADIQAQLVAMMDDWSKSKGVRQLHGKGKHAPRQKRCGIRRSLSTGAEFPPVAVCGRWAGHDGPHRAMGSDSTWD